MLGICDKIVPGLLIGALRFGHLPMVLIPGGPMRSGLPNKEKAKVRELYAEGKVGRDELLDAEIAAYHGQSENKGRFTVAASIPQAIGPRRFVQGR